LIVGESENKVEKARGDSLEEEAIEKIAVKKKSHGRKSRYIG